jgi:hypothetical protein
MIPCERVQRRNRATDLAAVFGAHKVVMARASCENQAVQRVLQALFHHFALG